MSADTLRNGAIGALVCLLLGCAAWFFFTHFQPSWEPVPSTSDAAAKNPVLGAERLLQRHGYRVDVDRTLSLALFQPLPEGTLILAEGGDTMLATQSQALLSWVERGNTLVVSPGWRAPLFDFSQGGAPGTPKNPAKDKVAEEAKDSITAHFGVTAGAPAPRGNVCRNVLAPGYSDEALHKLVPNPNVNDPNANKPNADKPKANFVECVATLTMPGVGHSLRIDTSRARLVAANAAKEAAQEETDCDCKKNGDAAPVKPARETDPDDDAADADQGPKGSGKAQSQPDASGNSADGSEDEAKQADAPAPVLADDEAKAVRVYAYGRGRVVVLAQRYFDNYQLASYDHAELLLGLAALNAHGKNVTLIQRVDIAAWYSILWHAAPYAICTMAAFLLLWAWAAMRRFGPQLPDPEDRRRALLEHVDASGRWLWKSAKGKEIMLDAMRRVALRTLARRIPELRKLAPERQVERIAADGKMSRADLDRALLDAPGRLPIEFTRQIQTIQELRAYYER